MRILTVIPPYVPSYFNAGHHLPVFQIGAALRRIDGVNQVECRDFGCLGSTWKDVCELLVRPFDVVAVLNDFDAIDGFGRFMEYVRELAPQAKTITFGRGSKQVPGFFERYGFDAIAASGDYEAAVGAYVRWLQDSDGAAPNRDSPRGVSLRTAHGYTSPSPGDYLPPSEWPFPDVDDIPYADYDDLYRDDLSKFCGIPERRELVVPVARGCPVGCAFCDVPSMQGRRERRVAVSAAVDFIHESVARRAFDYVSFYAPTFTLDRPWVLELCDALEASDTAPPWKCATTIKHLDADLVSRMAAARCVRISVGVETLTESARSSLPLIKRSMHASLQGLLAQCEAARVELNCFVILGLPGDRPDDVARTIAFLRSGGARVRPTLYTPYDRMTPTMSEAEYASFNRQLFVPGLLDADVAQAYYRLFHADPADRPTAVSDHVPMRTVASEPLRHIVPVDDPDRFAGVVGPPSLMTVDTPKKRDYGDALNLSSNEVRSAALTATLRDLLLRWDARRASRYPYYPEAVSLIARGAGLNTGHVVLTPGSDDAIRLLLMSIGLAGHQSAVVAGPTYAGYSLYATAAGVALHDIRCVGRSVEEQISRLSSAVDSFRPALLALTNPDPFYGSALPIDAIRSLAGTCGRRGVVLLVDEAYGPFAAQDHAPLVREFPNVLVLRTYSKCFGLAGLRIAAMFGSAPLIEVVKRWRPTNGVSAPALDLLCAMVENGHWRRLVDEVIERRSAMVSRLAAAEPSWRVFDTHANFITIDTGAQRATDVAAAMHRQQVVVKDLSAVGGLGNRLRMTVVAAEDEDRLLEALSRHRLPDAVGVTVGPLG